MIARVLKNYNTIMKTDRLPLGLLYLINARLDAVTFISAFAKLRKVTLSFLMSLRPSVCPHEKLGFQWKDFSEI
jgi:hypothetical protein